MSKQDLFDVSLKKPLCLENLSEDELRAFVNALQITPTDDGFTGLVRSSEGVEVKFNFGSDGNFQSVTAKLNGQQIVIIPGNTSQVLYSFKGPPSSTNPGPGWTLEAELTQDIYDQPANEALWKIFFASRADVLNELV